MKNLKKERHLEQVNKTLLEQREIDSEPVIMVRLEAAEMWSFVGSKKQQRWLWSAIDHRTGKMLAYVFAPHEVREAIEAVGAKLVFLPPYSPDLSPIELCWSKLKQLLRSAKARTKEALDEALTDIINHHICADNALGWFAHCGLFI